MASSVGCALPPSKSDLIEGAATYAAALHYSCPAPLSQLGTGLGAGWVEETILRYGLREIALAELEPPASAGEDPAEEQPKSWRRSAKATWP